MTVYVYRLLDAEGRLLYVGHGKDPARRLAAHRRKPWGSQIATMTTEGYPDRADAEVAEARAIYSEMPAHNRSWNVNPARPLGEPCRCNLSGPKVGGVA
jgi:hypothetical protein